MRIAYVTTYDARDVSQWSGIGFYEAQSLAQAGADVDFIGPLESSRDNAISIRLRQRLYERLLRNRRGAFWPRYEPVVLRDFAAQVREQLRDIDVSVVFSPGTLPIAYLKTDLPIVFWADATFASMVGIYPGYSELHPRTVRMGHAYEKAALKKAALALYSSDWAARSAVDAYGIDPRKVAVVPFGPNLDTLPDAEQVTALVQGRDADVCRLLFIGVEWERKGGDIAIEAAQALNDAGVPTQLTVIGCRPPMSRLPEFVSSRGFISKTTESGCAQLRRIMGSSHFLIHPARAEAFGVVFAEAAAFAVPAIASEVGGIPTAIRNGRNGYLLPSDSDGEAYATLIKEIFDDRERYRDLAMSSFGEYETRLSWRTGAETVIRYVQALS